MAVGDGDGAACYCKIEHFSRVMSMGDLSEKKRKKIDARPLDSGSFIWYSEVSVGCYSECVDALCQPTTLSLCNARRTFLITLACSHTSALRMLFFTFQIISAALLKAQLVNIHHHRRSVVDQAVVVEHEHERISISAR